jgi:serine/threonine protein kinase/Tol biopolymer transport system component
VEPATENEVSIMSDSDLDRVREIFEAAVEETGEERERVLDRLCGGDAALRARVKSLLAAHDQADDALASPTVVHANQAAAAALEQLDGPVDEPAGTRIGPYKLLERIGEGGFGVVYMAEQEEPIRRRVALKIIKPGMDSKQVIARFEAERQALALLDHPSIARVLDAGATDAGRPYFVMELVRGIPINEYCDANTLSTRERLDLFREVCNAIHHAHQKGIIHRDIKPNNILVTLHDGTPVPKIIDFGVAKATNQRLTEKTLFTNYNQFIGTPAYMSPEQAALGGLEIDARSDIYSLGVLLYELLTGTTPIDSDSLKRAAYLEVMRMLRDDEPERPSTRLSTMGGAATGVAKMRQADPHALAKLLRGDIDWMVMKALEKKRDRRYETAAAFAADITRFFGEQPITARPPSTIYRAGKFARRHRRSLAAAGVIAAMGLTAATAATIQRRAAQSPSAQAPTPTRRLVLDWTKEWPPGWPTRDGMEQLRYDNARGGFVLLDEVSRRTTPLTRGGSQANVVSASLSPDRTLIATVVVTGEPEAGATADSTAALRVLDVGSTGMGRVIRTWEDGAYARVFGWSPDQMRVWLFIMNRDRSAQIASIPISGGSLDVLRTLTWRTHTQSPSLSPDGRFIAYHDADTRDALADVFIVATDGSRQTRLEHAAADLKPFFTPDGSGIVFDSNRRGTRDLWFQPLTDGRPAGDPRIVVADINPFGMIHGFADNGSLYYFFAASDMELYTGRLGQPDPIRPAMLTRRNGEMNSGPSFSPDGAYLAHLRDRGRRLVLRRLADGAEREIPLVGSLGPARSDWCPDGGTILVHGYGVDAVTLRVNVADGTVQPIDLSDPLRVICGDNERSVVYASAPGLGTGGTTRIARRDLATGDETQLVNGPVIAAQLQRSTDGAKIGFVEINGDSARIVVMPVTGGEPSFTSGVNLSRAFGQVSVDADFMFTPDGTGLVVVRDLPPDRPGTQATRSIVWFEPFDGSPARRIASLEMPEVENAWFGSMSFALHPDGSTFAFERHTGTAIQDWAIDNLQQFIQSGVRWDAVTPPVIRR